MKTDLLNIFNRFATYLEKNNSGIRIKIENDNVMFSDRTFVFDYKHDNIHYVPWFLIFEKPPLETQIDYFFFGKNCESAKNSNIPVLVSIFEYCNVYSIDKCQMAPFGFPSCFEELAIKMDLMGI